MGYAVLGGVLSLAGAAALTRLLIGLQLRLHVSQVQKSYGVGIDADVKGSTPTLGGVAFILIALAALVAKAFSDAPFFSEVLFFWSLPIACGLIGFADDFIKLTRKSSEGFTSMRKLAVQLTVASVWVFWARSRGVLFLWPGLACPDWLLVPAAVLAAAGMMNAINVTDGLDGLAGGAFLISLGTLSTLAGIVTLPAPELWFSRFAILFGTAAGFLFYNVRPARIFMGDAGSHFLGGALVAICVSGGMAIALIPAGFIFGVELLSSAAQIISIRKFDRKIFRMAPLHHHFQLMGWDETTVTMRFLLIHATGAALTAALCVSMWGLGR
ncbi:MAG: phospho-N-acetylmuramoyl-pentapeptide-transferase [Synergistaceae bacterium]|nr:phospho-N-acetylmuramoyl-pentapeptide-transferase [Synergistaceae bacterium]